MRVISGTAKGRRLRSTKSPEMRPTTDMARQTIFDMLGDAVEGARVLDLCAGAGTLGIEALSRGAHEAVFVDQDRDACAVILQNLESTGLRSAADIRRADVLRILARPSRMPFDLVFLDPPYARGLGFVSRVLGKIGAGGWTNPGATVVVEAPEGDIEWPPHIHELKSRRFGRTRVSLAVTGEHESDLSRHV
ncbi:MAG TPA: 16S rRNA (guanine(966)-N(2))-methyltransferase RsmD [Actinomycetota bacterium]|nr:16S rRNA (guanine(966)-N(2))-methyltransferase RsmD [Actinomycetota bacterium]